MQVSIVSCPGCCDLMIEEYVEGIEKECDLAL
jgi:hypothetical protein